MRLTTWNVNGIRNPFSYPPWNTDRSFRSMFDTLGSDIVVMQELKIQRKDLRDDMVLIEGWDCYFSLPKQKRGYSGVGIYTRNSTCAPIRAEEGLLGVLPASSGVAYCDLPESESIGGYLSSFQIAELGVDPALLDAEGRCVVVEFPAFVLFGVYSPANSNGLRDDFRFGFLCALDFRIRNLIKSGKRVVLVGDLNVSSREIDSACALEDCRKSGISHMEYISTPNRRVFNQLLIGGDVAGERDEGRETGVLWDTCRGFHPERAGMYTHWETKINARPGNYGSRIDFVLVSESMRPWIKDANIQEGLQGSDHCPVYADFHERVRENANEVELVDIMSPSGTFQNGKRVREWALQSTPMLSAKRMPEFDKRRTIKSMFAAPLQKKQQPAVTAANEASDSPVAGQFFADATGKPESTPDTGRTDPITSPPKRAQKIQSSPQPLKRTKPSAQEPPLKRQQSLKGFFTRTAPGAADILNAAKEAEQVGVDGIILGTHRESSDGNQTSSAQSLPARENDETDTAGAREMPVKEGFWVDTSERIASISPEHSPSTFTARLEAAEQTQKVWGALFSRPVAPLCEEHGEACKTMMTKKKGSNQGRSFWICARPLGPSGDKERGTEWRCPTFIWNSDWQSRRGEEGVK